MSNENKEQKLRARMYERQFRVIYVWSGVEKKKKIAQNTDSRKRSV